MKLSHRIKLFIAKKRGQVVNVKKVDSNWQLPDITPKPISIPKPVLSSTIDHNLTLKEFITARKSYLEDQIALVKDNLTRQVMDEEYQQLEKIEEILWPLIKD